MTKLFWFIYHLHYWQVLLLVALIALIAALLTRLHNRLFFENGELKHTGGHRCFQLALGLVLLAGAAVVLWLTVFSRDWGSTRLVYLKPGRLVQKYLHGNGEAFRTMFMNVCVFTPFGAFLGTLMDTFRRKRISGWQQLLIILAVSAAFSCILELWQYLAACGETDIEDLITNTLGGVMGYGLYKIAARFLPRLQNTHYKHGK